MLDAQRLQRTTHYVRGTVRSSSTARSSRVASSQGDDDITHIKAHLLAHLDGEARIARVEQLAAAVAAGSYRVDAQALANTMCRSPETLALLVCSSEDLTHR